MFVFVDDDILLMLDVWIVVVDDLVCGGGAKARTSDVEMGNEIKRRPFVICASLDRLFVWRGTKDKKKKRSRLDRTDGEQSKRKESEHLPVSRLHNRHPIVL